MPHAMVFVLGTSSLALAGCASAAIHAWVDASPATGWGFGEGVCAGEPTSPPSGPTIGLAITSVPDPLGCCALGGVAAAS